MKRKALTAALLALTLVGSALPIYAATVEEEKPDHYLPSTPENVVWGYLSPDVKPRLTIESGDTVKIDTVNVAGVDVSDPEGFFEEHNIPITDSVADMIDIIKNVKQEGVHVLTGPIYIEDAQPGDMLEVRIKDVAVRSPYFGTNLARPGIGGLPDLVKMPWLKVIHYDMENNIGLFDDNIEIPLEPFMGIMGIAPTSRVPSGPPGTFGGNLDLKELTAGSTLFLPVQVEGGLFYTGDAHGAQGDGEVNITGLETSATGTFEFILHKNKTIKYPMVETADHYIVMGLDEDLDTASRIAIQESIDFLSWRMDLTPMEAFSISSLAVDFEISQLVDGVKGVHGMIPKQIFKNLEDNYWASE